MAAIAGFELFVARRYLRAKRKQAVISAITVISVAGVAAGVMALVVALAINNGFRITLQRSLLGATAHVTILSKDPSDGIANWRDLDPKLRKIPHVIHASPSLYGYVLLAGPSQSAGAELKGIPLNEPPDILLHLKSGSFDELAHPGGLPGIILGSRLAQSTGMIPHSVVTLIVPNSEVTPLGVFPKVLRFRVVGIFETGFYDIDSLYAFSDLSSTQKAFSLSDVVNAIELRLDDIYRASQVAKAAERVAGPNFVTTTWMEQFHQILSALQMEKIVTAVTIGLIQLVAALNILITLMMMVMEKNRDIAVLISMGARPAQIRKIFMLQGVLIGVVGTVIGLVLGYSLSYFANQYHWLRLDQDVYAVSYVPFNARWVDGVWIAATAIFISFIATLYPSRAASRIAPAEALRYE